MSQENKPLSFNTTIRNPERYTKFLKVVEKFHNLTYSESLLLDVEREWIKHGVYEPVNRSQSIRKKQAEGEILSDSEVDEILRNNPQKLKWIGRAKSHLNALRELAFLRIEEGKLRLTTLGFELLDENINFNDFWTKLLLKIQFGNPFRKTVKNKSNPFLFTLHVISQVNLIWKGMGEKPVGISRTEFQYFVLPMVDNDYNQISREIVLYREKFKFSFNESYLVKFVLQRLNNNKKNKNIKDTSAAYTDNVIRHFFYTNLISFAREDTRFINISEGSEEIVKEILSKFKLEWRTFDNESDYVNFLLSDIKLEWKIRRENQEDALWNLINDNKISMEEVKQELKYLEMNRNKEIRKTFFKGFDSEEKRSWWTTRVKPPLKLEVLLAILFALRFDKKLIKVNPKFLCNSAGLPYLMLQRRKVI